MSHQAQYSAAILEAIALKLGLTPEAERLPVFDPFAGPGNRLAAVCDDLGIPFSGIDIEAWPGRDPRVRQANAVDLESYPTEPCLIITSPTYPGGMNDHFTPKDTSRRYTYRVALGRELHVDNSGRYSIRGGAKSLATYWLINRFAVACWAELGLPCLVNIKDVIHSREIYPVTLEWEHLLAEFGYRIKHRVSVRTPGMRNGANREARVDAEVILSGAL